MNAVIKQKEDGTFTFESEDGIKATSSNLKENNDLLKKHGITKYQLHTNYSMIMHYSYNGSKWNCDDMLPS